MLEGQDQILLLKGRTEQVGGKNVLLGEKNDQILLLRTVVVQSELNAEDLSGKYREGSKGSQRRRQKRKREGRLLEAGKTRMVDGR
jgi:hypothetical protein